MTNIIILYWDTGCPIRNENTKISWSSTKKMVKNLKEKGLDITCTLFEYGKHFYFEDSIKIDMELGYYERSKKINIALNHQINENIRIVAIMDSDLFFIEEQYDEIYDHIKELESGSDNFFYTYNLLDLNEDERKEVIIDTDINTNKLKDIKSKLIWRHSWGSGTLGGFFITPLKPLKSIGGYNENYLTWGVEDDDALTRIKTVCEWRPKMWTGPYHLFHPKNTKDEKYYIKVYTDEYFEINKVERPK
jgi:predicted glycosyltransferase involved in capsule biosynthesis